MTYTDPGDQQERSIRRKPRPAAPAPAGGQNDLFRDTQPPKGPSEGEKRKEKALEKHEQSGRAPLIRYLRAELKKLQADRDRQRIERLFGKNPVPTIDNQTFVTADDAVRILRESKVVPTNDDGTEEERNWMGALFKEPGWRYTGRTVPSLRDESNGRHVRCWRWEGE